MNYTEERRSNLEDRIIDIIQSKQQTESQMKMTTIGDIWDNIKWTYLCVIGFQKENKREKGIENVLRRHYVTEKFLKHKEANNYPDI